MTVDSPIPNARESPPELEEPPVAGTGLEVDIARIQPYEHNPRHSPNPEYDRIRDSIRNQGLDQPLVITQRPGVADYIVHAGGNTRLLILKNLFEETGDSRYTRVPCLFRPWIRESDVLLAHLRENDLRGSLAFIDKARAVLEAQRLLTEELGLEEVTQRRLETELCKAGYRITQGRISQVEYAVYRLIPLALEHGMGRPQVERIRRLEQAADTVWRQRCPDDAGKFDTAFVALCSRYDGPDWNTDLLREALETEIAEAAEISIQTIRVVLDAELAGRELVIPELEPEPPPVDNCKPGVAKRSVSDDTDEEENPDLGSTSADDELSDLSEQPDTTESPDRFPDPPDGAASNSQDPPAEKLISPETGPSDLKSLRGRAWTLAARLAQRNGIGELVEPLPGKGLGFVLQDVPDPALAEQLDEESLSQISMLWWQLAACAEITCAPLASILPLLPDDSILRRALEQQDADLLFKSIWTLDPGHTGYRLWRPLNDRDWSDLINLMDTYRRIRRTAVDMGTELWE
jgi:ParB family protein of integrating conjugative element (PFGI_1 class)